MTSLTIVTLCVGFANLAIGSGLLQKSYSEKQVGWLLIATFPAFVLFAIFPQNTASGTVLGISVTGAVALFLVVWNLGKESVLKAISVDDLNSKNRVLEEDLRKAAMLTAPSIIRQTTSYIY